MGNVGPGAYRCCVHEWWNLTFEFYEQVFKSKLVCTFAPNVDDRADNVCFHFITVVV